MPLTYSTRSGRFAVLAFDRHLIGDGEIIGLRLAQSNQPHGLVLLACAFFVFHAVTQQAIDLFIGVIEFLPSPRAAAESSCRNARVINVSLTPRRFSHALQYISVDVAVPGVPGAVTQMAVT